MRFIDLYAGVGGLGIPFRELGWRCVLSSEILRPAIAVYIANHGDTPVGNIDTIPPSEIPDHDLLLAGFPCQPFSQGGKSLGVEDERGGAIFTIGNILREKKPLLYLLENVSRLKTHPHFKTILEQITDGYELYYTTYNTRDWGLPQNRNRIYMVGIREGEELEAYRAYRESIGLEDVFTFPTPPRTPTRVGDILEDIDTDEWDMPPHRLRKMWERHRKWEGKCSPIVTVVTPDTPHTRTLTKQYYADPSRIMVKRGDTLRRLTTTESKRLQGFPDSFDLSVVSRRQACELMGNSVSLPVIRAIAWEVYRTYWNLRGLHRTV